MFDGIRRDAEADCWRFREVGQDRLEWRGAASGCHSCIELDPDAPAFGWRFEVRCAATGRFYRGRKSTREAALADARSVLRALGCGSRPEPGSGPEPECRVAGISGRPASAGPKA